MSPTSVLLQAAEEVILTTPRPNWTKTKEVLIHTYGYEDQMVDDHEDHIRQLCRDFSKQARRTSPKMGSLISPAASGSSYSSNATQNSSAADEQKNPEEICLAVEGPDDSVTEVVIGCEWGDGERSIIASPALEHRGLSSLIDQKTRSITLSWYKPEQQSKLYRTLFRVVSGSKLPDKDIRFGKDWMQSAPLEIATRAVGGKRKRSHEQDGNDELERVSVALSYGISAFLDSRGRYSSFNRLSPAIDQDDGSSTLESYGQPNFRQHGNSNSESSPK